MTTFGNFMERRQTERRNGERRQIGVADLLSLAANQLDEAAHAAESHNLVQEIEDMALEIRTLRDSMM